VAATILIASDGGILPPVFQPTCGWKPLNRQPGKPAATFSDTHLKNNRQIDSHRQSNYREESRD
jgi:hypothetical protein